MPGRRISPLFAVELLASMQSGKPFELDKMMRTDPEVVRKLRKLKEAGLLNMEFR